MSTCRILKKLDLRKNPITDHDHFIIAINGLFPKLKILNHFNLAEYISSNVKQDASFNSTKEAIIMECIRYLEGTIKDRDLFQETILDDSKETIAIVKSHYQKLKTYLGKYEPPFTAYISSRDDTSTEETMDIQDKNIAWLETALLAQLAQMTKFLKQISPTCDYFVLSKLDSLRKTSELMKITRIQALWRKRQLLGKYQYIRSSVIKIQKTWRNYKWKKAQLNALKVRKQKLLSAVIVFQKYFRGRKARKEARLLKIQNKYYKKKPKKHIIAAHKAEPITYVEQEIVKPTTAIPDIDLIVEDTDLDKWINNTQTETFNAELDSYLENDLVSKEVAKQPTQEPKANKKVRIEELKQHTETKPEDILFEPRKETPPSKVHHNALPKTTFVEEFSLNEFYQKVAENMERTKDSKKPNTNILSQTLLDSRASTPKSSRSLKSRVQTPETRATSRSEVALITDPGFDSKSHSRASSKSELIPNEWNLTSKQSIESLSRKNERFSALARKSAQKEILKDPEERLKQFQRVKNHVVYEWDTPASITVKKPFEKLPPIETNDELRHYNYPTPKVQPGVVLLMNNYVAGKFIKEYEKPIGVPKFQLLKFPKL